LFFVSYNKKAASERRQV